MVARQAHNLEVVGSRPSSATNRELKKAPNRAFFLFCIFSIYCRCGFNAVFGDVTNHDDSGDGLLFTGYQVGVGNMIDDGDGLSDFEIGVGCNRKDVFPGIPLDEFN